ncbi:MAG: hypothetical protein ACKVRO_15075 [Micropepsaceae bacterium]
MRIAGFCLVLLMLSVAVPAKVIWPQGWAVQSASSATVAKSPVGADGVIVFLVMPGLEASNAAMSKWLDAKVRAAVAGGTVLRRQGAGTEDGSPFGAPTLYTDGLELKQAPGQPNARIFFFAYQLSRGRQLALVISPMSIDKNDPRILTAMDTIADGWKGNLPLSGGATATSAPNPATTPRAPASQPGSKPSGAASSGCRTQLVMITTWSMRQVCSAGSFGGMQSCHLESVPIQQPVEQEVCG